MSSSNPKDEAIATANAGIGPEAAAVHVSTAHPGAEAETAAALTPVDDVRQDGGLQAWLQVAASFALYFNHL